MLNDIYVDSKNKVAYTLSIFDHAQEWRLFKQGVGEYNQIFFTDNPGEGGNVDDDWQVVDPKDWYKQIPVEVVKDLIARHKNNPIFNQYIDEYNNISKVFKSYYIRVRNTYEAFYKVQAENYEQARYIAENRMFSEMNDEVQSHMDFLEWDEETAIKITKKEGLFK